MREVKFKIWGPNSNYMWQWDELQDAAIKYSLASAGESIPLQFTGLSDKNGVDIYEGDLLDREGYGLFAITVDDFHGYRFMMGLDQLCKADAVYGQVIGNICQNPEIDYRGKK